MFFVTFLMIFCCFFSDDDIVKLEDNGLTNNGWMKLDSGILNAPIPPRKNPDIVTDTDNIMENAEESDPIDSRTENFSEETATPQAMIQIPSEPRYAHK